MEEMEKKKTSASTLFPPDYLLHKVFDNALDDDISYHRKETDRDPRVKQHLSSETPFVRLDGIPGLLNFGTNEQTNKNLQNRKVNISGKKERPKLADLDLFIRPDGLPITFVVASSGAEQRRQVKIKKANSDETKTVLHCVALCCMNCIELH